LLLRRFEPDDLGAFAAYRSHPGTARWQSWETPYPVELARTFIAELTAEQPGVPGTAFQYAIEQRDEPGMVGDVMVATGGDRRLAELGVTLAPDVRGRGLATEAIGAVLDHVLVDPGGVHRVVARCDPRNAASVALWHRLGFREEAVRLAAVWSVEGWTDEVEFALLADEWPG
jgi:RimJ/RimL family protein N-acetyltransferase